MPKDLKHRVASKWLLRARLPRGAYEPPKLPVGLIAALKTGDRVRMLDGAVMEVSRVSPEELVLTSNDKEIVYERDGFAPYAWAYFAGSDISWLF